MMFSTLLFNLMEIIASVLTVELNVNAFNENVQYTHIKKLKIHHQLSWFATFYFQTHQRAMFHSVKSLQHISLSLTLKLLCH